MPTSLGPLLIGLGLTIALVGVLAWGGALGWLGHLPGDIRVEGEHTRVYVPLVSMLLISVVLTLLVNLVRRLF